LGEGIDELDGPRRNANPDDNFMNIAGRKMRFNEKGNVFYNELGLVGTLKCGLGSDC
jgi:hypothetical protein